MTASGHTQGSQGDNPEREGQAEAAALFDDPASEVMWRHFHGSHEDRPHSRQRNKHLLLKMRGAKDLVSISESDKKP